MASIFTFAAPWHFSQASRAKLLSAFFSSLAGRDARILTEESDSCFTLQCSEQAFNEFVWMIKAFVATELDRKLDVFENRQLLRVSGTSAFASTDSKTSTSTVHLQSEVPESSLFTHENVVQSWTPKKADGRSPFLATASLIGKIESLAVVRMEGSLETYELTIKGDAEDTVSNAIRKLETLDDTMAHPANVHNYAVLEGDTSVKLQFLPLKEIPDSRLKTTLLATQSPFYKSLRRMYVTVMIKNGEIAQVHTNVRTEADEHLWRDHSFTIQFPSSQGPNIPTVKTTPIGRWVEESSTTPVVDPFVPRTHTEDYIEQQPRPPSPKPSPPKQSTKRARVVKGAKETASPIGLARANTSQIQSQQSSALDDLAQLQTTVSKVRSELGNEPPASSLPINQSSNFHSRPAEKMAAHASTTLAPTTNSSSSQLSTIQTHIIRAPAQQPPPILPPWMPLPQANPRPQEPNHRGWDNNVVTSSGQGNGTLIDLGQPSSNHPKKQLKGKKHYTMNQRKPQVIAGEHALVKKFQETTMGMLRSAVARPGVELTVNIGRILIDHHTIPTDFRKQPFEFKEWPYAVGVLKTEFTRMLTTESSDASNILNTKLSQGRRLFVEQPIQRKVTYIVECQTKSKEHVSIEVNENKRFKIRGPTYQNGAINWHFVKRAWDAQLVLTSEKFIGGNYLQEVQNLAESIKIDSAPHINGLELSLDTEGSDFQIKSVLLRRETVHIPTTYPDLLLHLAEIQDFKVTQDAGEYSATIEPQDEMAANHRLWWEVSVSSQQVSDNLKENDTLELGEKAQWKAEQIVDNGVVGDLYALAQEIVTRIDHVGVENRGPAGSESKTTTKPSEKSIVLPTGPMGYW